MSLAVSIASGFDCDRGCYFLTPYALSHSACSLLWAPKLRALFLLPDVASRLLALYEVLHGALRGALPGEQRGALPNASGWLNGSSGPLPAPHFSFAIAPGAALIAYERQDGRLD